MTAIRHWQHMIAVAALVLAAGCTAGGGPVTLPDADADTDAIDDTLDATDAPDTSVDTAADPADAEDPDSEPVPSTCGFGYETIFTSMDLGDTPLPRPDGPRPPGTGDGSTAHMEPPPPFTYPLSLAKGLDEIVMPGYTDDMPLFERAQAWTTGTRCYETPTGVRLLTEGEAFDLYRGIAETTTGVPVDTSTEVRWIVGLRGAYPGTFAWNGNTPDRFNDTIVLLWIDSWGTRHVREFHGHTDVGDYDFGVDSSSSLRPNRRYHYTCGWHSDYSAMDQQESSYPVRDDTNNNGHWDSDRNGWLPPTGERDYDRYGSAHNIHLASVDGPLGTARVQNWSAGCQTIPGIANWTEFIMSAWTDFGDPVGYYLVDVRDIPYSFWFPCAARTGTHECPFEVDTLPSYAHAGDTSLSASDAFDAYNCSSVDESGPEDVYALTLDSYGTLTATVSCAEPAVDVDVYLLDADDSLSCLGRDDATVSRAVSPGRYFVVADTYSTAGTPLVGPYTISIALE